MSTSRIKPILLIPIAMFMAVIAFWQFTFVRFMLMLILLFFSIVIAVAEIIAKHRKAYLQGRITSGFLIRNSVAEITGLLFAMILAGWLGRAIAQLAAQQISNELAKFTTGLTIGLLVGMGVGIAANHLGSKLRLLKQQIHAEAQ